MDYCIGNKRRWNRLKVPAVALVAGVGLFLSASLAPALAASANAGKKKNSTTQAPLPAFSAPGGVYTTNLSIRLSATPASAAVHYTLNGSDPTADSPRYAEPIEITNCACLKARIFESGSAAGPILSQTYILADGDVAGFNSNLPLVILNTFGKRVPQGRNLEISARIIEVAGGRSQLTGPAEYAGRGDLDLRGHTSLRHPKHSYHFQTKDDSDRSLKVPLLGMPKESDWILYAPYPDKTLIRDALAYELSNKIGRYAPRTRFVEVFVNETGGWLKQRDYQGVYVFIEKIKRAKERVNIRKLGPDANAEPDISGGYIFKKDHLDQVDFEGNFEGARRGNELFSSVRGNQFFHVEPKPDTITAQQKSWLRRYVNNFERALYGGDFKDPKVGYAAFIDPGSFIDHHLIVELSKNIDGFRFSTFYHKDRGGKLVMGPIWDWNLTFGNANARDGWIPEGWYWPQLDDFQYSWFRRLFEDPDFDQKYVDRWGELRSGPFSTRSIHARIDEMAALLEEAQERNFRRWRILGRHVWPNTFVGGTYAEEIDWMKDWIRKRIAWMDAQFPAAPALSLKPGAVPRGSKLTLRAPAGRIYYTLDGTDPRAPGGGAAKAAQSYSSAIVLNENATVFCRAQRDKRWSYPAVTRFTVSPAN
jgi:hypothetical protein